MFWSFTLYSYVSYYVLMLGVRIFELEAHYAREYTRHGRDSARSFQKEKISQLNILVHHVTLHHARDRVIDVQVVNNDQSLSVTLVTLSREVASWP